MTSGKGDGREDQHFVGSLVAEHSAAVSGTQVGAELKATGGKDSINGSAGVSGSANSAKEFQVNRLYGTEYDRNPLIVFSEFHYRVIVRDSTKNGATVFETPWEPGDNDIKCWNWVGDCSWVKQ